MRYREYFKLTRPSLDVPFHSSDSIFYQNEELSLWPTDVYTQDPSIPPSPVHAYYMKNYDHNCLPVEGSGYLSEDGLTVIYTVIYKTEEVMNQMKNDPFFTDSHEIQIAHYKKYNIKSSVEYIPIGD